MKKFALLISAIFIAFTDGAQIPITASGLTYTQNFNTLDSFGTGLTSMPPGWGFYEWGGASANTTYRAGTGSVNAADTYSFGPALSRERALGSLNSGSVANINYGVRFINNTGSAINAFTITFREEQWRRGGSGDTDSVRFYYSTAAGNTINDTGFSSWMQVPALLMTSVTTATPVAAINGNDTFKVITATVPIALPAGSTVTLRWYDYNVAGSDDGLAIDSVVVVFNQGVIPINYNPAILSLAPAPGATSVAPASNLAITFNHEIAKGASGNIYVTNCNTQATHTIAASSADVTVSGKKATISNVGLQSNATYYVTFDSTAFDTAAVYSAGLYDTTAWRFATTSNVGIGAMPERAMLPVNVLSPAGNGVFTVLCTIPRAAVLTVSVYDLSGREAARQTYNAAKGDNRIRVQVALPAGAYIIRVDNGREWGAVQVVLQ